MSPPRIARAGAVALIGVAALTACGGTKTLTRTVRVTGPTKTVAETSTVAGPEKPVPVTKLGPAPPAHRNEFGYIKSLSRKGSGYMLRFDPAAFLTGVTANQAALEDTGSSDVPNDNYVVNETPRAYTYRVPADAHVTVLAEGVEGTPITVAELAALANGENPLGHPLFEPLETGFWILVDVDTVKALDQQYVP
jgi:hypothetical protein